GRPAPATAPDAAANPFADLGLPEITVTITETAIEGAPAELAAGRYVLAVTNATEDDDSGIALGVGFLQPPEGMTGAEFAAMFAPATPEAAAANGEASPPADGGDAGPPPWYYETALAGGIDALAGETAYTVLDLTAGEWVLWAEDPTAPQPPVPVIVTGDAPADPPAPTADVTITGLEMSFTIEGTLASGPRTIAFTNGGQQPHFLLLLKVPEGTTVDDFLALAATFGDPAATPPGTLTFDQITDAVSTGDQSSGVTTWIAADLEAGTYIMVCFILDPETGAPHAMIGMIDVVTVV
ncbi:MAG: hypothetical protein ACRDJW_23135, partial [Thermomicrobiales bacterium]